MPDYGCINCNFNTKNKNDYNRHLQSKKHLNIIKNGQNNDENLTNNICTYCNKYFHQPKNLGRHLNSCIAKKQCDNDEDYKNIIAKLTKELETSKTAFVNELNTAKQEAILYKHELLHYNEKISHYKEEISHYREDVQHYKEDVKHYKENVKHYERENEYYKILLNNAGGMLKKSISALSYIVNNYKDAPAIKCITFDDIDNKDFKNNKKIIELLIYNYRHKTLDEYIGNQILEIYKKQDPNELTLISLRSAHYIRI